jgi:hypothetical protein
MLTEGVGLCTVGIGPHAEGVGLRAVGASNGEAKLVRTASLSPWESLAVGCADMSPSFALHKAEIRVMCSPLSSR